MIFTLNHDGANGLFIPTNPKNLDLQKSVNNNRCAEEGKYGKKDRTLGYRVLIILSKSINFPFYFTRQIKGIKGMGCHTRASIEDGEYLLCCEWP